MIGICDIRRGHQDSGSQDRSGCTVRWRSSFFRALCSHLIVGVTGIARAREARALTAPTMASNSNWKWETQKGHVSVTSPPPNAMSCVPLPVALGARARGASGPGAVEARA
eukprot:4960442-Prymnesium_polylepis.1